MGTARRELTVRLKTYFANTVEAAMNKARQELGPEAMLVHSRKLQECSLDVEMDPAKPKAEYEVVFALGDSVPSAQADAVGFPTRTQPPALQFSADAKAAATAAGAAFLSQEGINNPAASGANANERAAIDQVLTELGRLQGRVDQIASTLFRTELAQKRRSLSTKVSPALYGDLRDADFTESFLLDLLAELPATEPNVAGLSFELARRILTSPGLGKPNAQRRIVVLAGSAGSGKTTTAAKLAARFGIAAHKPTHLISIDSGRVGGSDLLATFASLLGAGFTRLESAHALSSRLEHLRHQDLILVDTPGFSPASPEELAEIAQAIGGRQDIETQIVLAASGRLTDIRRQLEMFAVLNPSRILLTRLDETAAIGQTLEAVIASGLPVSFVSAGQNIPEDLEPADAKMLADLALRLPQPAIAERPSVERTLAQITLSRHTFAWNHLIPQSIPESASGKAAEGLAGRTPLPDADSARRAAA